MIGDEDKLMKVLTVNKDVFAWIVMLCMSEPPRSLS